MAREKCKATKKELESLDNVIQAAVELTEEEEPEFQKEIDRVIKLRNRIDKCG